jgi:hypothetical protein
VDGGDGSGGCRSAGTQPGGRFAQFLASRGYDTNSNTTSSGISVAETDELRAEIAGLRRELAVVRAEVPVYRGVWTEGRASKNTICTFKGAMWIALEDTHTRPGDGDTPWQLCSKSAKNGASVYDLARKHGFVGTERDYLASLRAKS